MAASRPQRIRCPWALASIAALLAVAAVSSVALVGHGRPGMFQNPRPGPMTSPGQTPPPDTDECSSSPVRGIHHGDLRLRTDGEIFNGLDLRGRIFVEAAGITVCNSIIRGGDGGWSGSSGLINNTGGFAGLLVVDSELSPTVRGGGVNGIVGSHFTARRVDIHHVIDGIHILGDNVVIEDSRIYDHLHYRNDPFHDGTPSHDDSIQIQAGHHIRITGNQLSGAFNAAVQITQGQGSVGNVNFSQNRLDGGGCSFNISERGGGPITGISVSDNIFGRTTRLAGCAVIAPDSSMPTMSKNTYPDGTPVTVRRGR